MVQVVDYKTRINKDGEEFFVLVIEGDLEMVKSHETGRFYATARRSSISSTFNEEGCKKMIGSQMPGAINKVPCDEYEYAVPESGEIITLDYRYEYQPEEASLEETILQQDGVLV
ncbi:MAG: hypothetical protein HOK72_11465 [Flavobacteriales bacterium]|jgi:hypothetical protein|nr:hypothetical protein [Flavobacteriales bacterium]